MNDNIINVDFTASESNERESRECLKAEKRQLTFAVDLIEEMIRMSSLYEAGGDVDLDTPLVVREVARVLESTLMLPTLEDFRELDM